MNSVGLTPEVYQALLEVKHDFENIEHRVVSLNDVIQKLIDIKNNGNKKIRKKH